MAEGKRELRVLVAEDDFLVAEMVRGQLEQLGHEVLEIVENGHLAAEKTRDLDPDVVLMDLNMPDMNGIDGMRLIRKHFDVPVVVLTAYETEDLLRQASDAGAGAYLVKPSSVADIDRALTIALARFDDMRRLRKANRELREALDELKRVRSLLPICISCKKVRDDKGYWAEVEEYLETSPDTDVSRCLCPDCMREIYPEFYGEDD